MSFPKYKWLDLFKDGWEDLGVVYPTKNINRGHVTTTITKHGLCGTQAHVGKEKNNTFQFCPRCLCKLEI